MRYPTIICIIFNFLIFNGAVAGSFSELFGSEGAAGIANPKTRSLSWSMQYLTFAGTTGLIIKNLHDNGFFEPFGFTPDLYKKMSPLAYDKKLSKNFVNSNIRKSKELIFRKNEILKINERLAYRQPPFALIKNEQEILFDDVLSKKEIREKLTRSYFEK